MTFRVRSILSLMALSLPLTATSAFGLTLDELKEMSLDELASVKVSIASKTPQKLSESPAAVYLVTQEDIRRSGATTIPELLRSVPGMNVASITGSTTAVSARGFHDIFSNKFLVMMDGRSLYTPLFSGMYWDAHDIDLRDIDRIEIIRGPSAAVWGANAMNGVINIITRSAFDTDSQRLSMIAGNQETIASFSSTSLLSQDHALRIWAKFRDHDAQKEDDGEAHDAWHQGRVGLRLDSYLNETDTLSLDGSVYEGQSDHKLLLISDLLEEEDQQELSGAHVNARWQRQLEDQSISAQFYIDHTIRNDWRINQRVNTLDASIQHTFQHHENGSFTWGLNHRYVSDHTSSPFDRKPPPFPLSFGFTPASTSYQSTGISFQEEYWVNDQFKLLGGVRFDKHDFIGWEAQPTLRALWKVSPEAELWAAVSRAIRTPSRYESHLQVSTPIVSLSADQQLLAESLTSTELGIRLRPRSDFSFNGTLFYNRYKDLASLNEVGRVEPIFLPNGMGGFIPSSYIAYTLGNNIEAQSYGTEIDARWNISDDWRLKLSYSWMKVQSDDISHTQVSALAFNNLPKQQLYLNSAWDLRDNLELDATLYYVDELKESNVDAYTRFDLRLGWMPYPNLELSLIGKNLLDAQHAEYVPSPSNYAGGVSSSEVPRSVTAQAIWKF